MSGEGFGGLLADSNLFQRILVGGMRRQIAGCVCDCDLCIVTSSLGRDIKSLLRNIGGHFCGNVLEELKECYGKKWR